MITLSVKNPYSYLICAGLKDVENRTWKTDFRGTLQIHSSGSLDLFMPCLEDFPEEYQDSPADDVFAQKLLDFYGLTSFDSRADNVKASKDKGMALISGAIIGTIEIVDCVKDSKSLWAIPGQYHWILKNPVLFDKPVLNIKGKLRFFDITI